MVKVSLKSMNLHLVLSDDALSHQELVDLLAMVPLKLDDFAHFLILHDSAIASEFLEINTRSVQIS